MQADQKTGHHEEVSLPTPSITEEEIGDLIERLRRETLEDHDIEGEPTADDLIVLENDARWEAITALSSLPSGDGRPASRGEEGWQPIETAPGNGARVLVRLSSGVMTEASRLDSCGGKWIWPGREAASMSAPTHWMPLPAPPGSPGEAGSSPYLTGWNDAREAAAKVAAAGDRRSVPFQGRRRSGLRKSTPLEIAKAICALEPPTGNDG